MLQVVKTKHCVLPNEMLEAFSTVPGCDAYNPSSLPRKLVKYIHVFCYSSPADWNSMANPLVISAFKVHLLSQWRMRNAAHLASECSFVAFIIIKITAITLMNYNNDCLFVATAANVSIAIICALRDESDRCSLTLHLLSRGTCSRRSFGTTRWPHIVIEHLCFLSWVV